MEYSTFMFRKGHKNCGGNYAALYVRNPVNGEREYSKYCRRCVPYTEAKHYEIYCTQCDEYMPITDSGHHYCNHCNECTRENHQIKHMAGRCGGCTKPEEYGVMHTWCPMCASCYEYGTPHFHYDAKNKYSYVPNGGYNFKTNNTVYYPKPWIIPVEDEFFTDNPNGTNSCNPPIVEVSYN